jgi:hypothetical protein
VFVQIAMFLVLRVYRPYKNKVHERLHELKKVLDIINAAFMLPFIVVAGMANLSQLLEYSNVAYMITFACVWTWSSCRRLCDKASKPMRHRSVSTGLLSKAHAGSLELPSTSGGRKRRPPPPPPSKL